MNRFDLEQSIMNAWHVVDDVKLLYELMLNQDMKQDDIANFLLGMSTIYQYKFEKLFATFEDTFSLKKE